MLRPEVRYARADDGVAIAYSVVGDGPMATAWHALILADVGRPGEAADWSARADEAVSRGDRWATAW